MNVYWLQRKEWIKLMKICTDIKWKCASTWKTRNETLQAPWGVYLNFCGIASEKPFCLSLLLSVFCITPEWWSVFLPLLAGVGQEGRGLFHIWVKSSSAVGGSPSPRWNPPINGPIKKVASRLACYMTASPLVKARIWGDFINSSEGSRELPALLYIPNLLLMSNGIV